MLIINYYFVSFTSDISRNFLNDFPNTSNAISFANKPSSFLIVLSAPITNNACTHNSFFCFTEICNAVSPLI